jgi:hypothetical protein
MGKKNKQKLDMDSIDFEESSYYDPEEDYDGYSPKKSKKEKRRDRRNNNDYYGNDAYDDYGYGGREGAFEDYSDQDEDYYALDSIDDLEGEDDYKSQPKKSSSPESFQTNPGVSGVSRLTTSTSNKPEASNSGFSSHTSVSSAASSGAAVGNPMFREVTPQPKPVSNVVSNNVSGMIPRVATPQSSSALNDSTKPAVALSQSDKAPLRPTPQPIASVEKDVKAQEPKSVISAEKSREPQESEWSEITEGKARSQKKKREKSLEEKEREHEERSQLEEQLEKVELTILELEDSRDDNVDERSFITEKRKLEKERLSLLIKKTQWELSDCIDLQDEETGDDDKELIKEENELREKLKQYKLERKSLSKGVFSPLRWPVNSWNALTSCVHKMLGSFKKIAKSSDDEGDLEQELYKDDAVQERMHNPEEMERSTRKSKAERRKKNRLEELDEDSEASDSESYYPYSDEGRNWHGIFKRTAVIVTAVSLLLTIGYSTVLIYKGQKSEESGEAAVASVTDSKTSDGAISEQSKDSLWSRVKNMVSRKPSSESKYKSEKLLSKRTNDEEKVISQNGNSSQQNTDPSLKSDSLENETELGNFSENTDSLPENAVDDPARGADAKVEDFSSSVAGLLTGANDVSSEIVQDASESIDDAAEDGEEIAAAQINDVDGEPLEELIDEEESGHGTDDDIFADADADTDAVVEGTSVSSYPTAAPQIANPVATFGDASARFDGAESQDEPIDLNYETSSLSSSNAVPTAISTANSSIPSGAEWEDEPAPYSPTDTEEDLPSENTLATSASELEGGKVSSSVALDDDAPLFGSFETSSSESSGQLASRLDAPDPLDDLGMSGDLASPSTERLSLAEASPLELDDSLPIASLANNSNSFDGDSLTLESVDDSLGPINVSNMSSLDDASIVGTYPSGDSDLSNNLNLLSPLATTGTPTLDNSLAQDDSDLNFTLPEGPQLASASLLDEVSLELDDGWNAVSNESIPMLDSDEGGSRISRNLNMMSEQISGALDDFSAQSSGFTERLNTSAQDLSAAVQSSLDSVNQRISDGLGTVQDWSQQASNELSRTTTGVSETIANVESGLRGAYDNVSNSLSDAYNNTLNSLQGTQASLQSNYEEIRNTLSNNPLGNAANSFGALQASSVPSAELLASPDFNNLEGSNLSALGTTGTLDSRSVGLVETPQNLNVSSPLNATGSLSTNDGVTANADAIGTGRANVGSLANNVAGTTRNLLGANNNSVLNSNAPTPPVYGGANSSDKPFVASNAVRLSVPTYEPTNNYSLQGGNSFSSSGSQSSQGSGFYQNSDAPVSSNAAVSSTGNFASGNNTNYTASQGSSNATDYLFNNDRMTASNSAYNYNSYEVNDSNAFVASNQASSAPRTAYREYVTKEGDNLLTIAVNELGSSSRWSEIKRLNNLRSGATYFEVGTVIKLPLSSNDE